MNRPFRVTVVAVIVLLLAAINFVRLAQAVNQAEFMHSLGLDEAALALAATGAIWAIGFGAAGIGLLRLRRWAWRWGLAATAMYPANVWLVRLLFERSAADQLTRPADVMLSILGVIGLWALLLAPSVRRAFSAKTEQNKT